MTIPTSSVTILHKINTCNGAPLPRQVAKDWNQIVYTEIEDHVLDKIAELYKERYGQQRILWGSGRNVSKESSIKMKITWLSFAYVPPTYL